MQRASDAAPRLREVAHTADAGFEVEAPDLAGLFERAGLGLLAPVADLEAVEARSPGRSRPAERGVVVRARSIAGIAEEMPWAYKDVADVVEVVARAGLARIVARLRPLVVVKG